MKLRWLLALIALPLSASAFAQEKKELRWGTDPTGGAPYVFQDAQGKFIGFEYEFAAYLAQKLGRESVKVDADWSTLPELLDKPRVGDKAIDQFVGSRHVVFLPRPGNQPHRAAGRIAGRMNLRAQPAPRPAQTLGIRPPLALRAPAA